MMVTSASREADVPTDAFPFGRRTTTRRLTTIRVCARNKYNRPEKEPVFFALSSAIFKKRQDHGPISADVHGFSFFFVKCLGCA